MPGLRAACQDFLLDLVEEIIPGGENRKLYEQKFAQMSDEAFEQFIEKLEQGQERLCVVVPNFSETAQMDVGHLFEVADRLGHKFFQRIHVPPHQGLPGYLTPIEYLVLPLPVRRQAQLLEKKISIPADNNSVDDFTGQVTGASKGSKISFPEVQVLAARGLDYAATEFLKYRGGDEGGFNALNTLIARNGSVSQAAASQYATGVKSKQALNVMLRAKMLKSTL